MHLNAGLPLVKYDNRTVAATKRWVPPSIVRRDALPQEDKQEITFRRVRGILNKLTPEKFDKLSDDLLREELNSRKILKGVIFLVFEKALDEPKYSAMYARLCQRLCEEVRKADEPEPCEFRHLLLNSCQIQFENRSKHFCINKRKSLGNIKFIGELCKLGVVRIETLYQCARQLLVRKPTTSEMAEDLECFCQILRTCGKMLDNDQAQQMVDVYFKRMTQFSENPALPIRIRFMLKDIIELRKNKWVPRKATNNEGPQPINEICDDGGSIQRGNNERPPQQELFPRPLKTRSSGLDNILHTGSLSFPQHDKFPYHSNGFQSTFNSGPNSRDRGSQRQNYHHLSQNNSHFYQQNRYNSNQHNNNNSNNVSNNKDLAPRFIKRIMTGHDTANIEQVSLRPPAHSMLFKPPNTKPVSTIFPGRTDSLPLTLKPQNPPPIQTTKEVPILIKQASADRGKPNKKEKAATKEETLKKTMSIAEEVMSGGNIDEAATNFQLLKVQDRLLPECIASILNLSHHKTDSERENLSSLLTALYKNGSITASHYHDAFRSVIKRLPDLESTVPNIYGIVADYSCTAITEGFMSISLLGEVTEDGSHFPFLFISLSKLNDRLGNDRLKELFSQSKVNLMNSLSETERTKTRLNEVLEERGLVFLEPLLVLEKELWAALEREPTAQSLYRCAKETIPSEHHTSPAFITALVTVILRYITQESGISKGPTSDPATDSKLIQEKEKPLLERFKSVLEAFLREDINLQVTAIYALQVYCYTLDFPKGMLLRWFLNLYDLEVVEEEAFLKWKEDVTELYPGKGKALFQVNQWLTWLAEAESEEEEEDEDGDNY